MNGTNDNEFFPPPPAIERAPCAFCGKPTAVTTPPAKGEPGEPDFTESHQVTVQYRRNAWYHPPGKPQAATAQGILSTVTCDICPECFAQWLQPWFEQKGIVARFDDQAWGAETPYSRPRDI